MMDKNKKYLITCKDCKKTRLVNTRGMLIKSYEKLYPRCHKCGAKNASDKISKTWFKKEMTPWNIGTVGIMKANSGSIKKGERRSIKTEFKKGQLLDEKSHTWKGDNIGYARLHVWVKEHKGKSKKCEFCGSIKMVEWANKSHEYKRDLDDWLELCRLCHRKYDSKINWGLGIKKFGKY